jgi:superfamily II DNA or RNA helicase
MKLRPYQENAVQAVAEAWQDATSALIVLPTGTGKTVCFAELIRRCFPARAMVLAHREELIYQARDKIHRVTGLRVEVEMGDQRAYMGNEFFAGPQVVVSTIQTQTAGGDGGGRMGKFLPSDFGLLVIDEGHHSVSASWKRCIAHYRQNPNLKIVGVTATPDRADEEALGQVYDSVAYDYEILDAIHDGWLTPIEQQFVVVKSLDYSHCRTTAGDLNGADLAAVMEYEENLQAMAAATLEIAGDKRCLAFAASVAHAERLADILNRHKPNSAAWVCGKTPKDARRKMLADYAAGAFQYMVNCGVLTEGFDDPGVECVIMGRATKSRSLYAQMIGRATRPADEIAHQLNEVEDEEARRAMIAASRKPSCLVVDFVGNAGRHKLVTTANILGGNVSEEAIESAVAKAVRERKPFRMDEEAEKEEQKRLEKMRLASEAEIARRAKLVGKASWTASKINPFDLLGIRPTVERGWDKGRTLSDKQRNLLLKQGIDPDAINYSQGRQLVAEICARFDKNLCSMKQIQVLKKYGYDGTQTRDEAKAIIDGLAANGWRKV